MENKNLTEGSILKSLLLLALPIMGTAFVQMAYNLTDIMWVGRLGSRAVASVGTAGFFTWFAMAPIFISKVGAEVGIAQSVGREDLEGAKKYIRHSLQTTIGLSIIYALILILFRKPLIGFFNLKEIDVVNNAQLYLWIIGSGMTFFFLNPIFTAILNGYGKSKQPFLINTVGLIVNMILDPILILGFGSFSGYGVKGAAIATVLSQIIVTLLFIVYLRKYTTVFHNIQLIRSIELRKLRSFMRLGIPVAVQSGLFTIIAMVIARFIADWGPVPVAVQKIGSQIEAISWATATGFSTAVSTFVGQNYGANKWERINKGYFSAFKFIGTIGIITSLLLIFAGEQIFTLFIKEPEAIQAGIIYLRILGYSQFFMCVEITTAGAFNGIGKTIPPSIVGVTFNALRIPLCIILSSIIGLNGIWWSISMSSVLKGIIITAWFILTIRSQLPVNNETIEIPRPAEI